MEGAPVPDWHPIMAAVEDAPGFWRMVAQYERTYGLIRLVRRGGVLGYRADSIARVGDEPVLVGYYTSLRAAASAVHQAELQRGSVNAPPEKIGR